MHPIRKKRLTIVLFLLLGLGIAVGLTTYALRQNINLFYDPTQISAGEAPVDVRIRAGGMVEEGSVLRDPDSLKVEFKVTDFNASVPVQYTGILPDLFAEGQGVVAMGRLDETAALWPIRCLPSTMKTICRRKSQTHWRRPPRASTKPVVVRKPCPTNQFT